MERWAKSGRKSHLTGTRRGSTAGASGGQAHWTFLSGRAARPVPDPAFLRPQPSKRPRLSPAAGAPPNRGPPPSSSPLTAATALRGHFPGMDSGPLCLGSHQPAWKAVYSARPRDLYHVDGMLSVTHVGDSTGLTRASPSLRVSLEGRGTAVCAGAWNILSGSSHSYRTGQARRRETDDSTLRPAGLRLCGRWLLGPRAGSRPPRGPGVAGTGGKGTAEPSDPCTQRSRPGRAGPGPGSALPTPIHLLGGLRPGSDPEAQGPGRRRKQSTAVCGSLARSRPRGTASHGHRESPEPGGLSRPGAGGTRSPKGPSGHPPLRGGNFWAPTAAPRGSRSPGPRSGRPSGPTLAPPRPGGS